MATQKQELPKIDFTTFVLSVSSAAYMGLGLVPGPEGKEPVPNLELAKQNIDLLELMAEKTKGNLSAEEDRLLQQLLFETRMRYCEVLRSTGKGGC